MEAVLDRYIEITPGVRSGKPRLANTRLTVADIVLMHLRLGQSLEEIAGKYELSLAAVYAAMAYYHDHRVAIDQSIEEDVAFAEAFRHNNPSPLQDKLKALRGIGNSKLALSTGTCPAIKSPDYTTAPDQSG
ncbi:MAG: DUF433 domain-containing protein [Anaerolineae bacterium]